MKRKGLLAFMCVLTLLISGCEGDQYDLYNQEQKLLEVNDKGDIFDEYSFTIDYENTGNNNENIEYKMIKDGNKNYFRYKTDSEYREVYIEELDNGTYDFFGNANGNKEYIHIVDATKYYSTFHSYIDIEDEDIAYYDLESLYEVSIKRYSSKRIVCSEYKLQQEYNYECKIEKGLFKLKFIAGNSMDWMTFIVKKGKILEYEYRQGHEDPRVYKYDFDYSKQSVNMPNKDSYK